MYYNSNGSNNVAIGSSALQSNISGVGSVAIGYQALLNDQGLNGAHNIAIGHQSGYYTNGQYNIMIGNYGVASESNTIRIGNGQGATFIAGIYGKVGNGSGATVYIDNSGRLVTGPSSRRFKKDIADMGTASEVLLGLRPVSFHYKPEDGATAPAHEVAQYGLIAEEVAEATDDLVLHDKDGQIYSVRYEQVNAMLLNEFLKDHRRVETLQKENTAVRDENDAMKKRLAELEARDRDREARLSRLEQMVPVPSSGAALPRSQ
jgi:hypothetical protein